ncbi:peptidoglycan-binding protein [Aureimonas psammosilenae]|uniref:peptidoglycan-binding protein n=1 Tax=Aureimonas psammosilenae TaxID=2495496 RepID=UPI0012612575|nr:peptidoglycan-binding protein [Aureimonas psammosilenae]
MVRPGAPLRVHVDDRDDSPLSSLSRTLDSLEARLAKLPAANKARRAPELMSEAPVARAPRAKRPAALSDAVSEIVMRRQMLDGMAARPVAAPRREAPISPSLLHKLEDLAVQADDLHRQDGNYRAMAEVAAEIQRLREEMKVDGGRVSFEKGFAEMREAFARLRRMMENEEGAAAIGHELDAASASLARLTEAGADRSVLNTLRSELEEIRHLVRHLPPQSAATGPERLERLESRYVAQAEESLVAKAELKGELERLRESLRSLAREDQIQAVERRWDAFEERYGSLPDENDISRMIRSELGDMRAKLETMADQADPMKAVEERWEALEQRLGSHEVEASIRQLSERMGQIEEKLGALPGALDLSPVEERIRTLAASIETLSQRSEEADLENFQAIEERLDEISRAIVATVPMAPIERIEARIAALTGRVDELAGDGRVELLSARIVELSERVEELAKGSAEAGLAERIEILSERFDAAIAELEPQRVDLAAIEQRIGMLAERFELAIIEIETPTVDTRAIEDRLGALTAKLEENAAEPRFDAGILRSLEAQIERLSENVTRVGTMQEDFEADFEQRLQIMEQKLEEHREVLIEAARDVADETARRMQAFGEDRQAEHVMKLSESLRSLESLSRESDGRSNQVFDAVHKTLLKIVDRLEQIEQEIASDRKSEPADASIGRVESTRLAMAPEPVASLSPAINLAERAKEALAAVRSAPQNEMPEPALDGSDVIEREEMNRPLEPGSGTPDIGALLARVRAAQRSRAEGIERPEAEAEARAAARDAAKAASEEVERLGLAEAGREGRGGLRGLLSRRRKAIITGVVAVIVALSALPMGKAMLGDGENGIDLAGLTVDVPATIAGQPASTPAPVETTADLPPASPDMASAVPVETVPVPEASAPFADAPVAEAPEPPASIAQPPVEAAPAAAAVAADPAPSVPTDAYSALRGKLPASALTLPAVPDGIGPAALTDAARAGDPRAAFEIGLRLMEGRGGSPRPDAALDWFAQGALKGFAPAQYSLGTLYEKGNGIARDGQAARDWYTLAAEGGNVRAMHNLAVLYATGIDGRSQPDVAGRWFVEAAEHGMRDSQYNLGILYARGSGVSRDLVQSYKWFSVVADSGDSDAAAKRDEIAKSLSAEDLAKATAATKGFTPTPRIEAANTVDTPAEWQDRSDQTSSIDMTKAVRNIQTILGRLGYDAGAPDGRIGEKTKLAIAAFQKDNGMSASGEIDGPLIRALLQRKNG